MFLSTSNDMSHIHEEFKVSRSMSNSGTFNLLIPLHVVYKLVMPISYVTRIIISSNGILQNPTDNNLKKNSSNALRQCTIFIYHISRNP